MMLLDQIEVNSLHAFMLLVFLTLCEVVAKAVKTECQLALRDTEESQVAVSFFAHKWSDVRLRSSDQSERRGPGASGVQIETA